MMGPPAASAQAVEPRGVAAIKPSHRKANNSSPPMETSTEISWLGRFLMSTASLAARPGSSLPTRTSSILYSWTSSPSPRNFSTPDSSSSGSIPDMNPTLPRFTPRRTRPGYILDARSIVPSPPSTKTRSMSVAPSGWSSPLTSEISTRFFSRTATSRSTYPSLTLGLATMPTLRIRAAFMVSPTADHLSNAHLVQGRLRSPQQVHRVLQIPRLPSCDGPPCRTDSTETEGTEVPGDAAYHGGVYLPVPYEAAASYGLGPRLELGLDEQDRLPQRGSGRENAFERDRERDKREVCHQQIGLERQIFSCQPAHVGSLHNGDAWIVTQRPVELPVAYVDSEHPVGSSLQECVGKPSRRCSGIEAGTPLYLHAELADGGVQFLAGPRHEAFAVIDG